MAENLDLGELLGMFQQLREQMGELREKLCHITVEGQAGGGMVTVRANCCDEILSVEIDPAVVDPSDVEMLQDLVTAAVNRALEKARQRQQEEYASGIAGPLASLSGLMGDSPTGSSWPR